MSNTSTKTTNVVKTEKITSPKRNEVPKKKKVKTGNPQPVMVVGKYDVEEGTVYQQKHTIIPGEGDFSKITLSTKLDIPHEYKHVVNQVFKLSSLLNQKGATDEQVAIGVAKLEKLINLSQEAVILRNSKMKTLVDTIVTSTEIDVIVAVSDSKA
jgi:hypothetical protein